MTDGIVPEVQFPKESLYILFKVYSVTETATGEYYMIRETKKTRRIKLIKLHIFKTRAVTDNIFNFNSGAVLLFHTLRLTQTQNIF